MDIYKMAKEVDADYYDFKTGYTYRIQDYNQAIRNGLPIRGIPVIDDCGTFIGYAQKKDE